MTKPNCGPSALAAILQIPVAEVEQTYAALHNKSGRWQGRSTIPGMLRTAKKLGCNLRPEGAGGSLGRWVDEALPGRSYFVRVGGHFVAVIDGKVIDQMGNDRMGKLARRRVTHAYFVA